MKQKEHIKQWTILHMLRRANQCVSKGSINQSPQLPICINLYKKLSLAAQAASWLSFSLLAWRMAWAMRWAFHCFPGSTLQTFCNASSWRLNVTWFAILSMRQVLSFNLVATPCTRKSQSCILCRCSWMIFGNYNLFHIPDWGRKEETEETAEPICNRSFFFVLGHQGKKRNIQIKSESSLVHCFAHDPHFERDFRKRIGRLNFGFGTNSRTDTSHAHVLWVTPVVVRNFTRTGCMGKGEQDPIATLEAAICAGNCWFPQWI